MRWYDNSPQGPPWLQSRIEQCFDPAIAFMALTTDSGLLPPTVLLRNFSSVSITTWFVVSTLSEWDKVKAFLQAFK